MSLHDYITTHVPRQIYPPGTVPAYSNYGAGLAGYIVQRIWASRSMTMWRTIFSSLWI